VVKSPEQLEDAAITDAIDTAVGLRLREIKRQMTNEIRMLVQPEVDAARLNGRSVNVSRLFTSVVKHTREVRQ
jgi:hypothetical protein